ncbi:hypothetical protein BDV95DRAFT_497226, partial [Massariosphaeria phaeospora]
PYLIRVTPSHTEAAYVSVENFEQFLTDVSCSKSGRDGLVDITFVFDTMQADKISYDFENLVVSVAGQHLVLGDASEAHTHLRFSGGPLPSELKPKLKARHNLDYALAKRDRDTSSWTIPLDQSWDSREDIATASFVIDVELEDLLRFDSPFNEATIKLEATKAIEGDFNIEVVADVEAHAQCSFPGGCRGYNRLGKKFQPGGPQKGPGFLLGGWDLTASASLGLSLSLDAYAKAKVTVPVKIDTPQGSAAWKNLFGGGGNTLDLAPNVQTPIISKKDAEAKICAAIAIGPAISLSLTHDSPSVKLSIGARLDLPRVSLCAELAQDVNADCDAGTFDEAVKLTGDIGVGLVAFGDVDVVGLEIVDFNTEVGDLYKKWEFLEHCYDISVDDDDDDDDKPIINDPPPLPDSSNPVPPPTDGNANITTPGTPGGYNTLFDCSGVAPSPGGQPCGAVTMLCPSAYTWSCGNGEEGVVPPGTFCACGAFRYPGWTPPSASSPACTGGIYCVSDTTFSVCSPAGIEPPQAMAPGTICRNGEILAARRYVRI